MRILVTGGAGFIGRWVCKLLIEKGHNVTILDNLSNGSLENIEEFKDKLDSFIKGDIKDKLLINNIMKKKFDICFHLAACINVQESIDTPAVTFENDIIGTFNVLEGARKSNTKFVFMSTCMVYNRAFDETGITEKHPTKPASPYSACKLSGEELVISYYHAYKLPTVVLRPFNTYGPFQKSSGEGGVVRIFIKKDLAGEYLNIYGDGAQTRDLLYVEDCAKFVIAAGESNKCNGLILNAGSGRDININDLAYLICKDKSRIKNIPHIHPQSEIAKLLCNNKKAMDILGWAPEVSLEEGIAKTREFIGIAQR